ncbi:MAG: hypothetical protein MUP17_08670 [candidate division Zixibacteria bacterium]|nr:hypothetical protein [candidate division Zixibacteria bacterium]
MKNLEAIRTRYLQQDSARRIGGLAANLARIASFADNLNNFKALETTIEESKFLIEWIVPECSLELQVKLIELQIQLSSWHLKFPEICLNPESLKKMINQASAWSKELLKLSGLFESTS